eukprot:scaffold68946_cov52-Phaeocystis_antarctica.AAC.2
MPSSVRKVRISSRMYGGVNIFHVGASSWLSTVASAPKRDEAPSTLPMARVRSFANCVRPRSSPVTGS